MKTRMLLAVLAIAAAMFPSAQAKPKIKILATGGTIAGAQASSAEVGYKSGTFSVDDLIKAVPEMKDLAELSGEQLANIGSQTMNHEIWLKLANRINEVLKSDDTDGVVITHGTDTMSITAATLADKVTGKTIVLTGAMIPYKFGSSDGFFNLGCALAFVQSLPAGVYVVMNGRYFNWDNVRKNRQTGQFEELNA